MYGTRKVKLTELIPNLTCHLCKGYIIDATTIIECLHSFCRSCIVKYLEVDKNEYCPECDVQLQPSNPLLSVRSDQMLQEIVYKLVPGLFQSEMERRRKFYKENPDSKPSSGNDSGHTNDSYLTSDDIIHLSMELETNDRKLRNRTKRYFKCPAAVTIEILKKLLVGKYDLGNTSCVDILYRGRNLPDDFLLMDISYKYFWRQIGNTPLQLCYRVKGQTTNSKTSHNLRSKFNSQTELSQTVPSETCTPISKTKSKKIKREKSETMATLNGIRNLSIGNDIDRIPVRGRPKKKLDPNTEGTPPAKKMKKIKKEKLVESLPPTSQSTGTLTEVQLRISENGVISATSIESGEHKIIQPKSPVLPTIPRQLNGLCVAETRKEKITLQISEPLANDSNKLYNGNNGKHLITPEVYSNNMMTITPIQLEANETMPKINLDSATPATITKLTKNELCSSPKIPTKRHHHVANGLNGDFKIVKTVSPENSFSSPIKNVDPTSPNPKPPKFFKSRHNLQGPSSDSHDRQKPIHNGPSEKQKPAHNGPTNGSLEKQKSSPVEQAPFKATVSSPPSKVDKSPKHGATNENTEHKQANDTLNNYGSLLSHGLVYPGSNSNINPVNLVPFLQAGNPTPAVTNPFASGSLTNFLTAMAYHSYQFPFLSGAYNNPAQATYSPIHNSVHNGNLPQNLHNGKSKKIEKEVVQKPVKKAGYIQIIPKGKPSSTSDEQKEPLSLKLTKGAAESKTNGSANNDSPNSPSSKSRNKTVTNDKSTPSKLVTSDKTNGKAIEATRLKENSSHLSNISKHGTDESCHNNNNNNHNNNNVLERSLEKILERVSEAAKKPITTPAPGLTSTEFNQVLIPNPTKDDKTANCDGGSRIDEPKSDLPKPPESDSSVENSESINKKKSDSDSEKEGIVVSFNDKDKVSCTSLAGLSDQVPTSQALPQPQPITSA